MNVRIADRVKIGVIIAVGAIMIYALFVSRDHITFVAHWLGIPGWQAETAFILVDLPALVGKVMQLPVFAASTRKAGREMTYMSGSISLVCNVAAGLIMHSYGAAGWGVFVVGMFLYMESRLTKIKPAVAVTRAKNAAATTIARTTSKSTGTGWSPARRAAHEARKAAAVAPVSPGAPSVATLPMDEFEAAI